MSVSGTVAEGKLPLNILAISMGAMVASAWAARYPGEIARMVLINTSSRADARFFERLRWRNYGTIPRMAARRSAPLFRERCILNMTAAGLPDLERTAQEFARLAATAPGNFMRQILASSRYSFPPRPNCPVLFLVSEGDDLVAPACTKRLASRWQAPLKVHPSAGHDLPLVAPHRIIRQVKEFDRQSGKP